MGRGAAFAICGLASLLAVSGAQAQDDAQKADDELAIAVMELGTSGNIDRTQVEGLELILADALSKHEGIHAVMPSEIEAMIGLEAKKQLMGCESDSNCLAEIGGALGASYMLRPQVAQVAGTWLIQLALIDTENASTLARATREVSEDTRLVRELRSATEEILEALPVGASAAARPEKDSPGVAGAPSLAVTTPGDPSTSKRAHSVQQGKKVTFWVGLGAGTLLAAGGGALWGINHDKSRRHDAAVAAVRTYLADTSGAEPDTRDLLTRTEAKQALTGQRIGVLLMAIGAGVIAGGVTAGSLGGTPSGADAPRVQASLMPLPGGGFASLRMTWSGP